MPEQALHFSVIFTLTALRLGVRDFAPPLIADLSALKLSRADF
ncbi:MAG: hypothetical protein QXN24_08835 [Candidatus Bathyarchaeia archaeon]